MRIDRQKATFEVLPVAIQMLGQRLATGSVTFPPAVFAGCLTSHDIAVLDTPSNTTAVVVHLTLRPDGGWGIHATCPWCGKVHSHGGGTDPLPYFGHRVADCTRGSYELDPRPR